MLCVLADDAGNRQVTIFPEVQATELRVELSAQLRAAVVRICLLVAAQNRVVEPSELLVALFDVICQRLQIGGRDGPDVTDRPRIQANRAVGVGTVKEAADDPVAAAG